MSRINLLPWREELRKYRNLQFYMQAGIAAIVGVILIIIIHGWYYYRIQVENSNIDYIKKENSAITGKVKEIQDLHKDKEQLLERMKIIQSLENDRVLVPKLLDAIPRTIPEGVYLKSIERKEDTVSIQGSGQTNTNISNFIKDLEEIGEKEKLFRNVKLSKVEVDKEGKTLNFTIDLELIEPKIEVAQPTPNTKK